MRRLLLCFLLCIPAEVALAQTIVESMQTTNNDKVLAMNIAGKKDGRPFRHMIQFDVMGMTQVQRDSLYQQTVRALGMLGISDVPGLKKPDSIIQHDAATVTFLCEMCEGKGRLEVYGNGITSTRLIDSRQDGNHSFPLRLTLGPGDYRFMYYQKRVLQIQSTFTVRAGDENVVKVK